MSDETKPTSTKLKLFSHRYDVTETIRKGLMDMPDFCQRLGYKFIFEMPSVHCITEEPKMETITYKNWWGKEREKTKTIWVDFPYTFYLHFSKELSSEELDFWRIWKLGYLCRQFIT